MPTMTDAFLNNVATIAAGSESKLANLQAGAQLGIGNHLQKLDAITPLVMPPLVPVVTHSPTLFSQIPYAEEIWKALVERYSRSITGVDFGYTLETATTPLGTDGQELPIGLHTKRTAISPSITYQEGKGNIVINFHKMWLSLFQDPDTNASALSSVLDDGSFDPMVYSSYSSDICFIQFDPTYHPTNIIDAFFVSCMFPTETGMYGFSKETATSTVAERSIPYVGIVQHNKSTFTAGQNIARALNLHKVNYANAPAIADAVEDKLQDKGLQSELAQIADEISSTA